MKIVEFLKKRWELKTNWDVVVVFFIFAITGMTSVKVKRPIFDLLSIEPSLTENFFVTVFAYVFIFFPIYQILFLVYGIIFGQFDFVWKFEKKMLSRLLPFLKIK